VMKRYLMVIVTVSVNVHVRCYGFNIQPKSRGTLSQRRQFRFQRCPSWNLCLSLKNPKPTVLFYGAGPLWQSPLWHDTCDTTKDREDGYDASSDEQVKVKVLMEMDQCSKGKLVVPQHFSLAHGPTSEKLLASTLDRLLYWDDSLHKIPRDLLLSIRTRRRR